MNNQFTIEIRPATLADAEAIVRVHVTAWQESYQGIIEQNYLDNLSYEDRLGFRKQILMDQAASSIHLVALYENQIVGFCDAGPSSTKPQDHRGEIYAIYLLEGYKHLGIGTKLMNVAMAHLSQHGLTPSITWVLEENKPACSFYEKYGGQKTGENSVEYNRIAHKTVSYVFGIDENQI
ncbi:MAG: GNAT family N-acetyltransferase [Alphaproteobacteria bacterium]|nr:GNAT family N-acetyltransferase [Alphaproteobacteria bacterium]